MYRPARYSLTTRTTSARAAGRARPLLSRAPLAAFAAFTLSACDGVQPTAPSVGAEADQALAVASANPPKEDKPGRPAKKVRGKARVTVLGTPADGDPAGITEVRFVGTTIAGRSLHGYGTVTGYRLHRVRDLHRFMIEFRGTLGAGARARVIEGRGRVVTAGDGEVSELADGNDFIVWRDAVLSIDVEYSADGNDL